MNAGSKPVMSSIRTNLEFKARVSDHEEVLSAFVKMGAKVVGVLHQVDTYFNVIDGRMKLRESDDREAELIFYQREERSSDRMESLYQILKVSDLRLKEILSKALGTKVVVRKTRRLLHWKNARIHLDDVEALGKFLEFEVVLSEETVPIRESHAADLATLGALKEVALPFVEQEIRCSYSDLMLSERSRSATHL